jgi:hypothetical protein
VNRTKEEDNRKYKGGEKYNLDGIYFYLGNNRLLGSE